jgi:hypothetical protein
MEYLYFYGKITIFYKDSCLRRKAKMKFQRWQMLSGTGLKIIGIILMTMDHLYQMFILQGAPVWFNWLGRPVAAIFLFLCAEGFYYTRSKNHYMFRLLIGFLFMSLVNQLLSRYMFLEHVNLFNNIFGTLLVAAFYMGMVDLIRQGIREKRGRKILLSLGGMLLPWIAGIALVQSLNEGRGNIAVILSFIPNPVSAEGGVALIVLGVLFYILRNCRLAQAGVIVVISVLSALTTGTVQWLMVAAVIPLLLYNGKRGRNGKYFFYVFYPAHIYLFYIIAWFLSRAHGLPG